MKSKGFKISIYFKTNIVVASLLCLLFSHFSSKSQILHDSLLIEGHFRVFHYLKPSGTFSSLVFVMHGSGSNGLQMQERTGKFEAVAMKENVLIVYPDGYKNFWNECRKTATSAANLENINENAFFESMINYFKTKSLIDDSKVFAIGTSGGGHMAYKLALTMPEKFKGIAALIANLPETDYNDCIEKKLPIPVLIINGTKDNINPYEGGEVILGKNTSFGFVRSSQKTFEYWSKLAGYNKQPIKNSLPDIDPNDGKTIEKFTFKSRNKPEITLLKVINGGHNYPNDIDVHVEAWEFFKRQMKK